MLVVAWSIVVLPYVVHSANTLACFRNIVIHSMSSIPGSVSIMTFSVERMGLGVKEDIWLVVER